jgi:hypothetical protein
MFAADAVQYPQHHALPIELFRLALLASTTQVLHMVQVQHSNASNWTDVL